LNRGRDLVAARRAARQGGHVPPRSGRPLAPHTPLPSIGGGGPHPGGTSANNAKTISIGDRRTEPGPAYYVSTGASVLRGAGPACSPCKGRRTASEAVRGLLPQAAKNRFPGAWEAATRDSVRMRQRPICGQVRRAETRFPFESGEGEKYPKRTELELRPSQ
jgi:hypothetical protein